MQRSFIVATLLFLADAVFAETFQCTDILDGPVIVTATVDEDGKTGKVSVAGVNYVAVYRVFGFDRTWAFRDESEGVIYKLRIEPNGDGASFEDDDVEGKASGLPRHRFKCQQRDRDGQNGTGIRPIVRIAPVYPARALSSGLEGYVNLSFTVATDGQVFDPVVVHSTDPVFEGAAIRAVSQWRYRPQPVEVTGVSARIEFVP